MAGSSAYFGPNSRVPFSFEWVDINTERLLLPHDWGSICKFMSKGKELRFDLTLAKCYLIPSSHSQIFYRNYSQQLFHSVTGYTRHCCTIISLNPFCWHCQHFCHNGGLWRNVFFISDCIVLVKHSQETSCMDIEQLFSLTSRLSEWIAARSVFASSPFLIPAPRLLFQNQKL